MRVFVTGGTGFLGKRIVAELLNNNCEVILLVRNTEKLTEIHKNIEIIYGSLNDDFSDKLTNIDVVIHNAAKTPGGNFENAKDNNLKNEFYKTNFEGTKNLIEICERTKVKRFIYISSHAVSVKSNHDFYTQSKREAEFFVEKSKLDWSIIRPSGIYGITNYWVQLLNTYKEKKVFILQGIGNTIVDYIYVDDLANLIFGMIKKNESIHNKYIAKGDDIFYKDFIKIIKTTYGYKYIIINIPLWLIELIVGVFGFVNRTLYRKLENIKRRYSDVVSENTEGIHKLKINYTYEQAFELMKSYKG